MVTKFFSNSLSFEKFWESFDNSIFSFSSIDQKNPENTGKFGSVIMKFQKFDI